MYSQRRKYNQERWLTESGDPANDLIAQQDSTPQLDWRYSVIELWIYVNPTSEQKGSTSSFMYLKRICPIINRCPYKNHSIIYWSHPSITRALISVLWCSGFLWFSAQCFSFEKTNARNARDSAQTKIPLLSLCFHSVFMFLFVFQLKELQRVGLTQGRKRWSVLVNQSVNESEMAEH